MDSQHIRQGSEKLKVSGFTRSFSKSPNNIVKDEGLTDQQQTQTQNFDTLYSCIRSSVEKAKQNEMKIQVLEEYIDQINSVQSPQSSIQMSNIRVQAQRKSKSPLHNMRDQKEFLNPPPESYEKVIDQSLMESNYQTHSYSRSPCREHNNKVTKKVVDHLRTSTLNVSPIGRSHNVNYVQKNNSSTRFPLINSSPITQNYLTDKINNQTQQPSQTSNAPLFSSNGVASQNHSNQQVYESGNQNTYNDPHQQIYFSKIRCLEDAIEIKNKEIDNLMILTAVTSQTSGFTSSKHLPDKAHSTTHFDPESRLQELFIAQQKRITELEKDMTSDIQQNNGFSGLRGVENREEVINFEQTSQPQVDIRIHETHSNINRITRANARNEQSKLTLSTPDRTAQIPQEKMRSVLEHRIEELIRQNESLKTENLRQEGVIFNQKNQEINKQMIFDNQRFLLEQTTDYLDQHKSEVAYLRNLLEEKISETTEIMSRIEYQRKVIEEMTMKHAGERGSGFDEIQQLRIQLAEEREALNDLKIEVQDALLIDAREIGELKQDIQILIQEKRDLCMKNEELSLNSCKSIEISKENLELRQTIQQMKRKFKSVQQIDDEIKNFIQKLSEEKSQMEVEQAAMADQIKSLSLSLRSSQLESATLNNHLQSLQENIAKNDVNLQQSQFDFDGRKGSLKNQLAKKLASFNQSLEEYVRSTFDLDEVYAILLSNKSQSTLQIDQHQTQQMQSGQIQHILGDQFFKTFSSPLRSQQSQQLSSKFSSSKHNIKVGGGTESKTSKVLNNSFTHSQNCSSVQLQSSNTSASRGTVNNNNNNNQSTQRVEEITSLAKNKIDSLTSKRKRDLDKVYSIMEEFISLIDTLTPTR